MTETSQDKATQWRKDRVAERRADWVTFRKAWMRGFLRDFPDSPLAGIITGWADET
jgi:hypothetical protein